MELRFAKPKTPLEKDYSCWCSLDVGRIPRAFGYGKWDCTVLVSTSVNAESFKPDYHQLSQAKQYEVP